ncbi:hypothetical protein [Komagataeibacter oboediens]|uniref:hypothetical protein n=1 Tax=Komagataeibacter oboediens TaxID=65958 RepID=UPI001C2D8ACC|nr:hypothetical protein [Komagataeibacter oboediens]MBV1825574.1 hypothetical protein [Komagataeibacter oboediens]
MEDFVKNFGTISQIGSLLISAFAFIVAFYSFRRSKFAQKEAIASSIWREYEKLAISMPKYYIEENLIFDFNEKTLNKSREDFEQYQWLISFTLTACEEVLSVYGNKDDWVKTIEWQVKIHIDFIKSSYFTKMGYMEMCSEELISIIKRIC